MNNGNQLINKPLNAAPKIAPRRPPVEFPKTPAAAPQKKCPTTPGIITVVFRPTIANIEIVPTIKLTKNPIKTAFGA